MRAAVRIPIAAEQYDDPKVLYGGARRRARTVKATSVERGPILANRRGVAAAKAAFAACVEAVLDNLGDPKMFSFRGYVGVCWMSVYGGTPSWSYAIVRADGGLGGRLDGLDSMDAAERHCRLHLTQHATDYHDDRSVLDAWSFLLPDQRRDHLCSAAWQRAMRAAEGLDGEDRRRWAGDHQDDFLPPLLALADQAAGGAGRPAARAPERPHDTTETGGCPPLSPPNEER